MEDLCKGRSEICIVLDIPVNFGQNVITHLRFNGKYLSRIWSCFPRNGWKLYCLESLEKTAPSSIPLEDSRKSWSFRWALVSHLRWRWLDGIWPVYKCIFLKKDCTVTRKYFKLYILKKRKWWLWVISLINYTKRCHFRDIDKIANNTL